MPKKSNVFRPLWSPSDDDEGKPDILRGTALDEAVRDSALPINVRICPVRARDSITRVLSEMFPLDPATGILSDRPKCAAKMGRPSTVNPEERRAKKQAYDREYRKTHPEYFKQKSREFYLKKKAAALKEAS